jgi:urease accessory protein UreE
MIRSHAQSLVALTASLVLVLSAAALAGTVKVESREMQRTYKRTSTRGGVRLARQLSREPCIEGVSWGFDREGIWVDKGCRAEFETGGPSYDEQPTGRTVTVESRDRERYYYRVRTRGGVRLYRQISRDACLEGVSWGFDRDGIWVDRGCRAEFEIGGSSSSSSSTSFFGGPKVVKVESRDRQRSYHRVSTTGGVRLRKQLSRDACVEGVSWGFDRDGIWVDQGCRGEFEVGH